jgi:hypothetical protein
MFTGIASFVGSVLGTVLGTMNFEDDLAGYNIMYAFPDIVLIFTGHFRRGLRGVSGLFAFRHGLLLPERTPGSAAELVRLGRPRRVSASCSNCLPFLEPLQFSQEGLAPARNIFDIETHVYDDHRHRGLYGRCSLPDRSGRLDIRSCGHAFSEVSVYDAAVCFENDLGVGERRQFLDDCGGAVEGLRVHQQYSAASWAGDMTESAYLSVRTEEHLGVHEFQRRRKSLSYPASGKSFSTTSGKNRISEGETP